MSQSIENEMALPYPAQSSSSKLAVLWKDLREAIRGSEQEFTEGRFGRAIILLAIPMVLEMVLESVFAVVDVFFVAKLGADAVATVGLTESVITLVYAVAIGLSMGTTALVARRIGEKDRPGAVVAVVQAIAIGIFMSLPITAVGIIFAPKILALMGASESIVETGAGYTRIMLAGNATIMLLFLINAIFRGAGDAAIAMRVLWIANALNIVLDPCLILGLGPFPELGVTGAAVATNIGRGLGVLYQLHVLFRGQGRVLLDRTALRLSPAVMLQLLRVSLGGVFQILIATASWVGLTRLVAMFGSAALAGYTIAIRIIVFSILPSWGLSNAAATLVGQNLGAKKPERAEKSVWLTGFSNMLFLIGVGLVFILFAERLVVIFTNDPNVVPYAVDCLRIVSYGYLFYAYGMVIVQAFNGAGDTYTPTLINLVCYWLVQIPLAYLLAIPLQIGATGVFIAITVAESLLAVVGILIFRRGKWKEKQV
ncbi:MATE family efflux transporter [candidate division KSB1 bacterium]|nr:MATE family efflux transporter [candidate division KSB1 bacterium]